MLCYALRRWGDKPGKKNTDNDDGLGWPSNGKGNNIQRYQNIPRDTPKNNIRRCTKQGPTVETRVSVQHIHVVDVGGQAIIIPDARAVNTGACNREPPEFRLLDLVVHCETWET